jgi:hypothetical protein
MAGRSRPAWRRPWAAAAAVAAGGCLLAGCSSSQAPAAAPAPPAATAPLATSLGQANGQAWAIVSMGGSTADDNSFWELFARPAGSTQWALVTPPGVADNGGLVAAVPSAAQGLDVAVRPSQDLTFSPLALTGNGGKTWDTGLVDASVAAVPDALALGGGRMLVLLGDGAIDQAAASPAGIPGEGTSGAAQPSASTAWTRLAAPGAIAGSAAGRDCHVTALTAVSLTAAGTPLVGASCARPGVAGIFTQAGAGWQAAGPALSGTLAAQPVKVLRLTAGDGAGTMALLQSGTGDGDRGPAGLLAAWTADGTHWTVSPPLPLSGAQVLSSGVGPGATAAWVLLSSGRAATIAGPTAPSAPSAPSSSAAAWRPLPAPPHGTAVLAPGPGGALDALAVSGGSAVTVFRLTPAGAWQQTQAISVPVQLGSSS